MNNLQRESLDGSIYSGYEPSCYIHGKNETKYLQTHLLFARVFLKGTKFPGKWP
jgi:hypothetical protein